LSMGILVFDRHAWYNIMMKKLEFSKLQGCGNDYVYFDCTRNPIEDPGGLAVRLSDRRFSIGGDGVILICPSDAADAKMRMFNADGSEGKMCGNGIRCVAKFLYDKRIVDKTEMDIETLSGVKKLRLNVREGLCESVCVDMGKAELDPRKIPVRIGGDRVVSYDVNIGGTGYKITCVSMGNPHCVVFTGDPAALDLPAIGPLFEHSGLFPEGVNTEFVKVIDAETLQMRVWERGSGETLACGTGACAAVVAACLGGYCQMGRDITVKLPGGELIVNYTEERVLMTGPAVLTFEGSVYI